MKSYLMSLISSEKRKLEFTSVPTSYLVRVGCFFKFKLYFSLVLFFLKLHKTESYTVRENLQTRDSSIEGYRNMG